MTPWPTFATLCIIAGHILNPMSGEMVTGHNYNILQVIEYRESNLFPEIKKGKPIYLRRQFQDVTEIPI